MAYSNLLLNITGILGTMFRLGKAGPHLRQGIQDPNTQNVAGAPGDIFIQHGDTQRIFQKTPGGWIDVRIPRAVRKSVTTSSYTVGEYDSYLGVDYDGAVQIILPEGVEGQTITIKDESGEASPTNSITLISAVNADIEGVETIVIDIPYGSLTLVHGAMDWFVVNSWGFERY